MSAFTGRDYARELVRIRDKRRCRACKTRWSPDKRRFDVHHLNGLCGKKSRRYDKTVSIEGLITLCHKCHMSRHVTTNRRSGKLDHVNLEPLRNRITEGETYDAVAKGIGVSQSALYYKLNGRA